MLFKIAATAAFAATSAFGAAVNNRTSSNYFTPSAVWSYYVPNGVIFDLLGYSVVSKGPYGGDITSLSTFTYPEAAAGKQCQIAFYLDDSAELEGSKKLDLFKSNSPAPGPTHGWGPGNQRGDHLGRISPAVGSYATWDETYNAYLTEKTPCQAPGTVEGFELVGVNDVDHVSWDPSCAGLRIIYS